MSEQKTIEPHLSPQARAWMTGDLNIALLQRDAKLCSECPRSPELERLRAALSEAVGIVEHWGGYASKYFQDKHDLAGDIAKLVAAAGPADEPSKERKP